MAVLQGGLLNLASMFPPIYIQVRLGALPPLWAPLQTALMHRVPHGATPIWQ
jgi:hypothetical protein